MANHHVLVRLSNICVHMFRGRQTVVVVALATLVNWGRRDAGGCNTRAPPDPRYTRNFLHADNDTR